MKVALLLILNLFNSLLNSSQALKCHEETIDHCTKCDTGENSDSCSSCESKYFLFLIIYYVYLVITLNLAKSVAKEIAMQTIISILEMFFVKKVDAKKGFTIWTVYVEIAQWLLQGCLKCTYEVSEKNENGNGNFVCNECLSDEYRLTENNVC